jgi:hypothetical protein
VPEDRHLVGFLEAEQRELRRRRDQAVVVEERPRRADLVGGEALEGMGLHGRDRHNDIDSPPRADVVKTLRAQHH